MRIVQKILIGLVLLSSSGLGIFLYQKISQPHYVQATYLSQARTLPAFALEKNDGQVFSNNDLLGHWTILFFGYSQCRSICPTTLSMLHQVYDILRKDAVTQRPKMFMVSLDTQHDTQSVIASYAKGFDHEFLGISGEQASIDDLTRQLGIVYAEQNGAIDHSGTITMINPLGEVVAYFTPPMQAKDVAHDIETMITTSKASL